MVVLPTTTKAEATNVAERMIAKVEESTDVTISAGLEEYSDDIDIDEMVRRADEALYAAKSARPQYAEARRPPVTSTGNDAPRRLRNPGLALCCLNRVDGRPAFSDDAAHRAGSKA